MGISKTPPLLSHSVSVTVPPPTPPGPSGPAVSGKAGTLVDAIPEELWHGLARNQLLLPLLRQEVIGEAVRQVALDEQQRTEALRA